MNRSSLVLLLVLAGCRPDAIHARVQIAPGLNASCIALDVLSTDGALLHTEQVARPSGRDAVNIAVFQGQLPRDVRLQARALWGSACEGTLMPNGHSAPEEARFEREVGSVTLELASSEDADGDGFVSEVRGGMDCDDTQKSRHPGAQEVCDATGDLNCNGRFGCEDEVCAPQTCARRPTALVFTQGAPESVAGDCAGPLTVARLDALGQPAMPGFSTDLTLTTVFPETAMVMTYLDASCSKPLSETSIPPGASTFSFYVRGFRSTSGRLDASSAGLEPASRAHTVRAGSPNKLVFTSPSRTLAAGECGELTLVRRDLYDNAAGGPALDSPLTTPTSARFYQDPGCSQSITQASFAADVTTRTFYFKGTLPGAAQVVATGSGLIEARQTQMVTPGAPAKLLLVPSTGQTLLVGECSTTPVTVRLLDAYDNPTTLSSSDVFSLSSSPMGSLAFFSDRQCTVSGLIPFPAGQTEASFYFKGLNAGAVELSVSVAGVGPVTQSHTLLPMVRRGSCTLGAAEASKACPMPISLGRRDRSFLVFQATSNVVPPDASFVRCVLTNTTTITCSRRRAEGLVNIAWQVVELSRGLRVQHFDVACTGLTTVVPITSVRTDKSFVLFSSSQNGVDININDYMAVRLASPTQVAVTMNGEDCFDHMYSLQVVEFEDVMVARGMTDLTGKTQTQAGLADEGNANALVLSTARAADETSNSICNRMVRSELNGATGLRFSRALGTGTCAEPLVNLSWERITFVSNARVQAQVLDVADGQVTKSATLTTAVEDSRTLLLSSSQIHGGQASGETSYSAMDLAGAASGRFSLSSPTQLEVRRDANQGAARWTAYVIQFDP